MIGLHTSKYPDPRDHRDFAKQKGWGATQSNFGSTQSFDVPREFMTQPPVVALAEPFWSWHAAYVAAAAPKPEKFEYHANYLKAIARAAGWWNVNGIVVHTGATVGHDGKEVVRRIHAFIAATKLDDWLIKGRTKMIVEVAANISEFNCNPQYLGESIKDDPYLGWCLDLAHVFGTGVKWDRLAKIIKLCPPTLVHCNFPGTYFASSCDVHGWRHRPELYKSGRKMEVRGGSGIEELTAGWDDIVRLIKSLKIPMVIEGSGFAGSIDEELEVIKEL